jgi:hypothetical protein
VLDEQYRQGQVTEQTLTRCGFQADTDWDGTCAGSRPDGGSAEHMQRAKCLTHEHQVRLREEVRERAQAQKQKREADARMKAQNLVLLNQQCEGLLVNAVPPAAWRHAWVQHTIHPCVMSGRPQC